MNSQIKYIYLDLDGTLLDGEKKLRANLLAKIKEMKHKHQIQFGLASGRCFPMMRYVYHQLEPELPSIANNGANIVDANGNSQNLSYITKEETKQIIDFIQKHNGEFLVYTDKKIYTNSYDNWRVKFLLENGRKQNLGEFMWKYELYDWASVQQDTVLKILGCTPTINDLILEEIAQNFSNLTGCSSEANLLDIYNKASDKYFCIRKVAQQLKIDLTSEVLYFGDNNNDYLALKNIPHSVCVGRSLPELIKVSKYVTDSANEDGVLKFLNKHFS